MIDELDPTNRDNVIRPTRWKNPLGNRAPEAPVTIGYTESQQRTFGDMATFLEEHQHLWRGSRLPELVAPLYSGNPEEPFQKIIEKLRRASTEFHAHEEALTFVLNTYPRIRKHLEHGPRVFTTPDENARDILRIDRNIKLAEETLNLLQTKQHARISFVDATYTREHIPLLQAILDQFRAYRDGITGDETTAMWTEWDETDTYKLNRDKLYRVVADIRSKYGENAVTGGAQVISLLNNTS